MRLEKERPHTYQEIGTYTDRLVSVRTMYRSKPGNGTDDRRDKGLGILFERRKT